MSEDDIRVNFLLALDRADVDVSDFEADFIESNLARFGFSQKQRAVIDRLMTKYEAMINFNRERHDLAEAVAVAARVETSRFTARARPRPFATAKEQLKQVNGVYKLAHAPVVVGSVKRNGTRLEEHWLNHATGTFNSCPFLQDGDEVEYQFYPKSHG